MLSSWRLKLKQFVFAHKALSAVVAVLLVSGSYFGYSKATTPATTTKYVLASAEMGTIIASVSGSGQVAPVTAIDVKPQVSETVTKVYVSVGQHVQQGQLLVQLDPTNESKALKQAQLSLESAQLALAKLQKPPTASTLAQNEDAVTQAAQTLSDASATLVRDYGKGFDTLAAAFVDLNNVLLGTQDFVNGTAVNRNQSNIDAYVNFMPVFLQPTVKSYRDDAVNKSQAALSAYNTTFAAYHAASRSEDPALLDALFAQTGDTARTVSDAVKAAKDFLSFVTSNYPSSTLSVPLPPITATYATSLSGYTNTIAATVASLDDLENTIANDKSGIQADALSLKEKQDSLSELQAGADPLDLQSQQLSIEQQQVALSNAEEQLADTSVRAPLDGIVSAIGATVGTPVASSAVSIIGSGEVAELTLNEVDAAKVSTGDKATLTFDAIDGLSIAGQVVEVDPVGTVSQGVVNYDIKVGFSDTTGQVKPGMSVTANIATQVKNDVLTVPNSAVVTQGGASFVLVPAVPPASSTLAASANGGVELEAAPQRVPVTTGLANDLETEIVSGLSAGDIVIARTITSGGATASTANTGLRLGGGGLFGGGGGGFGGGGARGGGATGR